jgi:hypothetical protein
MKPKFTPGPWNYYVNEKDLSQAQVFIDRSSVGHICDVNGSNRHQRNANCPLIAAAPEMYEVLEMIEGTDSLHGMISGGRNIMAALHSVLKKARGES